jgi:hypothetical protein
MITYQEEPFEELWPDMQPHVLNHWKEVGSFKDYKPDLDYNIFVAMQNSGQLVCCSARDDGKVVGYMIDFVRYHLHYKTVKVAISDLYYIAEPYRAKCARKLLKFIESVEQEMGVHTRVTRSKDANNSGKFHELMGYNASEVTWVKRL